MEQNCKLPHAAGVQYLNQESCVSSSFLVSLTHKNNNQRSHQRSSLEGDTVCYFLFVNLFIKLKYHRSIIIKLCIIQYNRSIPSLRLTFFATSCSCFHINGENKKLICFCQRRVSPGKSKQHVCSNAHNSLFTFFLISKLLWSSE